MSARSLGVWLALSAFSLMFAPVKPAAAVTATDARAYGLNIQHAQRSSLKRDSHSQAIELDLTLTNRGAHGLYDIRVFLIRPDTRMVVAEPARVRVLPAGESTELTWTFELPRLFSDTKLRNLTFRIEAVDQVSQEVVSFNQQSMEAR